MTELLVVRREVYVTLPKTIKKIIKLLEDEGQAKIEYTSPDSKSTNV